MCIYHLSLLLAGTKSSLTYFSSACLTCVTVYRDLSVLLKVGGLGGRVGKGVALFCWDADKTVAIKVHNVKNCSHTCTLTMEAISEFDSLTTCSKRVEADLVESRSEKFQEKKKNGPTMKSHQRHLYVTKTALLCFLWLLPLVTLMGFGSLQC